MLAALARHAQARLHRRAQVLAALATPPLSSAPATSRRVSAGIRPDPGAAAGLPSWWGATDWVEVEVRGAVNDHRDTCRAHHVQPDTVVAVARGMAAYADHTTGRDCRPTNARLVADLRISLSTVQRARRVLKTLHLVVELIAGRSIMTRAERLAAWHRGSSHRQVAAEFALCSRRTRRPRPAGRRAAHLRVVHSPPAAVEDDTPPSATQKTRSSTDKSTSLRANPEPRKAAPRPAATHKESPVRPVQDHRARRLADAVRHRLPWLTGTSTRRITPTLTRFAAAGWTPRDVDRALADALAARGWRLPRRIAHPAAYLAALL
ncbi:MAG: hypothetical protein LC749_18290, partial [Actinobacteria bacterium]|nr:hypothetical protein [Actinomycetota bacterium]